MNKNNRVVITGIGALSPMVTMLKQHGTMH